MVITAPTAAPPITQGSYSSDVKKVVINSGTIGSRSQCCPVAAVATLYQSHTGETTRPVMYARRQSFIVRQNRDFTEPMWLARENRLVVVLKQITIASVRFWHQADSLGEHDVNPSEVRK